MHIRKEKKSTHLEEKTKLTKNRKLCIIIEMKEIEMRVTYTGFVFKRVGGGSLT